MPTYAERYHTTLVAVVTITKVTVHELREFTKSDWYGFLGCEADKGEPVIFELDFSGGAGIAVVADDNGIGVDYVEPTGNMEVYALELPYLLNRMVIAGMHKEFKDHAENYTTWEEVRAYILSLGIAPI